MSSEEKGKSPSRKIAWPSSGSSMKKWQPDSKTVKEIRNSMTRLLDGKPKISVAVITQYAKIAAFLQDHSAVIPQLKRLNTLVLEKGIDRHLVATNDQGEKVLKPTASGALYSPQGKILSDVLAEQLAKFGFSDLIKINASLPSQFFREIVSLGVLGKDSGLRDSNHGDFSHAIQWLLIAWQQKDTEFLGNIDILELFKSFGHDNTVVHATKSTKIPGYHEVELTLWAIVLDRAMPRENNQSYMTLTDLNKFPDFFRSPAALNAFLCLTEDSELSFLRSLIISREIKRSKESDGTLAIGSKSEKKHKKFPNKEYVRSAISAIELPKPQAADEKKSIHQLIWKADSKEHKPLFKFFNDTRDVAQDKNLPKIREATSKMHRGLFKQAWSIYLKMYDGIEKDSTNSSEKILEKYLCYQLAVLSAREGKIALAESYMSHALSLHEALDAAGQLSQADPILDLSLNDIVSELEVYQHLLRTKKDDEPEKENRSCCIVS